jgi:Mrp family chromosome partitioning ATPase
MNNLRKDLSEILSTVPHPERRSSLMDLGMIYSVNAEGKKIRVVASVPEGYRMADIIKSDIESVLKNAGYECSVEFKTNGRDTAREGKLRKLPMIVTGTGGRTGIDALPREGIGNIVAVASGKGGVGKSFITAAIATHLTSLGYRTGILDADITGPCISRMLGLRELPELGENNMMKPLVSRMGIRVMSIDLIMDRFKTPLVWRGPLINSAIRGLFSETGWGDLHYLLVDLPPGTSDAPLTVFQSLTPDGVLFVTSPMEVARSVVARSISMAREMHVPVAGIIENMAFLRLPDGSRINVFGREGGKKAAEEFDVPYIGSVQLDPAVSALSDRGEIELYSNNEFFSIIRNLRFSLMRVSPEKKRG